MLSIREEIAKVERGEWPQNNNPLVNAPHTVEELAQSAWPYPYSRVEAVYPLDFVKENKFWPSVKRINDALGDRNLHCSCAPITAYAHEQA